MKVLHLIPAAFNYFDDIRADAFALVEQLMRLGVIIEALTVQFEAPSKTEHEEVSIVAPSRHYKGLSSIRDVETRIPEFHLIHVHAPLFGAAGRVFHWVRRWPQVPLIVTAHRRVRTPDFFSLLIWGYNWYYLPRLFGAARNITCPDLASFKAYWPRRYRLYKDKVVVMDNSLTFRDEDLTQYRSVVDLGELERLALKYFRLYSELAPTDTPAEQKLASAAADLAQKELKELITKNQ